MIVRNESAILERCLLSVLPYLSCYVVCDTGSTDNTVEIVERVLSGIPGEVHSFPFRDFGQARNEALDRARRSTLEYEYLLLIDADMELVVSDLRFRERLSRPGYLVRQVSGSLGYQNVRLLAREGQARYVGATHEYLDLGAPPEPLQGVTMLDHACGSSRSSKTERDLALLSASLQESPDDARSYFYLAQTLREAGRFEEAIAAYQRRIDLGGWAEEVWYSRFMIARCRQARGEAAEFLADCLEAYQLRPSRAEPLHALSQHYRMEGRNELSALFCEAGLRIPLPDDLLFVEEEIYRTGFRQELSISGYYCAAPERREAGRRFARELSLERAVSHGVRENVRSNWKHYARSAAELFPSSRFYTFDHPLPVGYRPCNPSLAIRDGRLWCVLRAVNYRLEKGLYHSSGTDGVFRTHSYLLELDEELQILSSVPIVEDPARPEHPAVDGLEDIRLIVHGEGFRGSATIVDPAGHYLRRMVIFELAEDGRATGLTLQTYEDHTHQKNWVPFVERGQLGFLAWTDPTVVLRWDEQSRQATPWYRRQCPLALEHLRGSSGAIAFDGGWLYVTHEFSAVGDERTYLHRLVLLDGNFRVRAVTEAFCFRTVGVEFCCGLVEGPVEGRLLLSFGVQDGEAWLISVSIEDVRGLLQPVM